MKNTGDDSNGLVLNRDGAGVLLLVDGHAYAYRAYYAIRSLNSANGSPTNAIYGFIKMISKLEMLIKPTHLAVIWDGGLSGDRVKMLPQYKAQRPPMPDALQKQLDEIVKYLDARGFRSLCQEGLEADDWLSAATHSAVALGMQVVIASSDKDFMQLVGPSVGLVNANDKPPKIWNAEDVQAKSGVQPWQIVDWLSLIGDAVDNIPGAHGVGPKTAASLLCQYGSVTGVYHHLADVLPLRVRVALEAARDLIERNQRLVALPCKVEAECDVRAWTCGNVNLALMKELLTGWNFRSLLAELENDELRVSQPELFG